MIQPKQSKINIEVFKYLYSQLYRHYTDKNGIRTLNTRPTELKILHIAKATGLSYKQARSQIDLMCEIGIIEKFRAWNKFNDRKNYLRLTTTGMLYRSWL